MTEQINSSFDEFEIAKSSGLEIEESDSIGLDAFLLTKQKKIVVKKDLPELQKRVHTIHELAHYITKNYLAKDNFAGEFTFPGLQESILDVYYQEKKDSEERYRRFKEEIQNLFTEDEIDEEELKRGDDIASRHRDVIPDNLKLENAFSELHTWVMTEIFYLTRMDHVKAWENVEALRFCNGNVEKLANSALKVIRGSIEKDQKMIDAVDADLASTSQNSFDLFPATYKNLEKSLDRIKKNLKIRRNFFREEEFRWNTTIERALERESIIISKFEGNADQLLKQIGFDQSFRVEGGIFFDRLFRFSSWKLSIADKIRREVKEHFRKQKDPVLVSVNLEPDSILINLNDGQGFKVEDSSITYGMKVKKAMFPMLEKVREVINIILRILNVTHWIEIGINFSEEFHISSEQTNRIRKEMFLNQIMEKVSANSPLPNTQRLTSSISLIKDEFTVIISISLNAENDLLLLTADIRSNNFKKYYKQLWDFMLDCYGLYITDLKEHRLAILKQLDIHGTQMNRAI